MRQSLMKETNKCAPETLILSALCGGKAARRDIHDQDRCREKLVMYFSDRLLKRLRLFLALLCAVAMISTSLARVARAQESSPSPTQANQALNRAELHQALLDLTNPFTVMCVAEHPDDEDGTTLIVLRRKYGVHTVSLFSTYGEGGQNAVGPELYEQLGVIRAMETRKAALIQGSEPYFLGMKDFGFSKSAEEAFKF